MRIFLTLALCLVVAPAAAAPAKPAQTKPAQAMTFELVRALDCETDCPEWIAAQGEIKPGSARLFKALLDRLDARRRPVLVNSTGGSVEDALEIGRLIRARRLAVAVAHTFVEPAPAVAKAAPLAPARGWAASYPALCASACAFILAAGVERYASPLATIGVHEIKQTLSQIFVTRRYLVRYRVVNGRREEISRQEVGEDKKTVHSIRISPSDMNARLAAYFVEMGEDPKLVALMQTATPEQIHLLTVDEETATRLVTVWISNQAAMGAKPSLNGLSGAAEETASGARASLVAEETWPLRFWGDEIDKRVFAAHFEYLRGGGGVVATFTWLSDPHAPVRFGMTPGAPDAKTLPSRDERVTMTFLSNEAFCRYLRIGDIFVVNDPPQHPPTHAPGLPDPRRPLLLTPVASVNGISALAEEICPP